MAMWKNITGKRLYVNADRSKVVEEGSDEAAYVLVGPEGMLTMEVAKQYGLENTVAPEKPKEEATTSEKTDDLRDKVIKLGDAEPRNKAVEPARDK